MTTLEISGWLFSFLPAVQDSPNPSGLVVLGSAIMLVVHFYQRLNSAAIKTQAEQVEKAIGRCEERCVRIEGELAGCRNESGRLRAERDVWRTRYEIAVGAKPFSPPTSADG